MQTTGDTNDLYLLAIIREIDSQVHEVVATKARLINDLLQHCLVHLIGDVTKHDLVSHEKYPKIGWNKDLPWFEHQCLV